MIKIIFNVCENSNIEIQMGMKQHFDSVNNQIQGVSATSNVKGFTPLTAIASYYRWDSRMISKAAEDCNRREEICIINTIEPCLFLVPKTKGDTANTDLITDLLNACEAVKIKTLRFTHYCFVQNDLPDNEVTIILNKLFTDESTLETIIWDIDSRCLEEMKKLYRFVYGSAF